MQEHDKKEQGFTLIELLVAIVVVGILTAVAIVGIGGLTNKGNSSACNTTADAAKAASAVHYANSPAPSQYPSDFNAMVNASPKELELQGGAAVNSGDPTKLDGKGWTLQMHGGGNTPNTFDGCPS